MEAGESLLSEEKIESVPSADMAATFKPQQHHWKCIRGVKAVFTVEVAALIRMETIYDGFMNNTCT